MAPALESKLRRSFEAQSLMATFGAEMRRIEPGEVELAAPILAGARQQHGFGHAGLTFALGDTAAGYAALSLMPDVAEVLTVEMKINLLSPVRGERLLAIGRVVKPGRRIHVVTAEVFEENEGSRRPVALLQGTMIPA
ncbi:PaaI family thioesterase [Tropicimonas aquimaris]|uniref:Medium/long-chain acyl-CoA thioesterase YigI n=1 Tax=Tropicimonas aquimaris TaxID=914152 RepID=A0ABW3IJX8_9RHOB